MSSILHIFLLMLCLTGAVLAKSASDEFEIESYYWKPENTTTNNYTTWVPENTTYDNSTTWVPENTTNDNYTTWVPENTTYDNYTTWIPATTTGGENESYPSLCEILDMNSNIVNGSIFLGNVSDHEWPHTLAYFTTTGVKRIYEEEKLYLDFDFDPYGSNVTIRLTEDFKHWKLEETKTFNAPYMRLIVECRSEEAYPVTLYTEMTSFSNLYAPIFENVNSAGYYVATVRSPMIAGFVTYINIRDPDSQDKGSSSSLSVILDGKYSWAFTIGRLSCTRGSCQFEVRSRFTITLPEPAHLIVNVTDNDYRPLPKSATASLWILSN